MEELSIVRVERASLRAGLHEMTALVMRTKFSVTKFLSIVPSDVQMAYDGLADVEKCKIQNGPVDGWKKIETHFQVESACLVLKAGDELLPRSSDFHSLLGKIQAFSEVVLRRRQTWTILEKVSPPSQWRWRDRIKCLVRNFWISLLKVEGVVRIISILILFKRKYCR